jgi:hypothetical protein
MDGRSGGALLPGSPPEGARNRVDQPGQFHVLFFAAGSFSPRGESGGIRRVNENKDIRCGPCQLPGSPGGPHTT